eukprot:762985-Hanusia_phi.AAC.2
MMPCSDDALVTPSLVLVYLCLLRLTAVVPLMCLGAHQRAVLVAWFDVMADVIDCLPHLSLCHDATSSDRIQKSSPQRPRSVTRADQTRSSSRAGYRRRIQEEATFFCDQQGSFPREAV